MWLSLQARFGLAERYEDYAGNPIEFNEYLTKEYLANAAWLPTGLDTVNKSP
jgi:hypothetical protein